MKRIYLFNIVAWNYRKKIGFPVCKMENFAGLQAHRKRGKSARASPTPHHTLNEERSARFTAQPLSALVTSVRKAGLTIYDHDSCRHGTQKSVRCPYTEIVFTHAVRSYANFLEENKIFYIRKEFNPHWNFFGAPKPQLPVIPYGCTCTVAICNLSIALLSVRSALKTTL